MNCERDTNGRGQGTFMRAQKKKGTRRMPGCRPQGGSFTEQGGRTVTLAMAERGETPFMVIKDAKVNSFLRGVCQFLVGDQLSREGRQQIGRFQKR